MREILQRDTYEAPFAAEVGSFLEATQGGFGPLPEFIAAFVFPN